MSDAHTVPKISHGRPYCPSWSEPVGLSPCWCLSLLLGPGCGGAGPQSQDPDGVTRLPAGAAQGGVRQSLPPAAKFPMCYLGSAAKGNVTFT